MTRADWLLAALVAALLSTSAALFGLAWRLHRSETA